PANAASLKNVVMLRVSWTTEARSLALDRRGSQRVNHSDDLIRAAAAALRPFGKNVTATPRVRSCRDLPRPQSAREMSTPKIRKRVPTSRGGSEQQECERTASSCTFLLGGGGRRRQQNLAGLVMLPRAVSVPG